MTIKRHAWTEGDDLTAYYLYRHGEKGLPLSREKIAAKLGMSEGSLNMRESNFASIDRGGGLSNVAKQSKATYERYRFTSESDLRSLVGDHLAAME